MANDAVPPLEPLAVDVLVIGGGVIGAAVAARLARTTASVILVERTDDLASGASKGNAGIASSYYAAPGTLEAELITGSAAQWEETCRRLDVPYRRIGALMVALNEDELEALSALRDEAVGCGQPAEIISASAARKREPMIAPQCHGALWLAAEGIIDPMRLTIAYGELAVRNGARVLFDSPVIRIDVAEGLITRAHTPSVVIKPQFVVDAAGLQSDVVSDLADADVQAMWPRKGQYWVLDREFGTKLNHIVFSAPSKDTKGIHVVPTTNGSALIGPSASDQSDRYDKTTDPQTLENVLVAAQRLVPSVDRKWAIKSFAALRPASDERLRLGRDKKIGNLVHARNRSTGVSSAPAMADRVLSLLNEAGLGIEERADTINTLPHIPRFVAAEDPENLVSRDGRYAQIVCVCEQVSAAEIAAALTSLVPARSIEGVRKRTRATGGRCQGSVCMAGVAFMCSLELKKPPGRIPVGNGGELGLGKP